MCSLLLLLKTCFNFGSIKETSYHFNGTLIFVCLLIYFFKFSSRKCERRFWGEQILKVRTKTYQINSSFIEQFLFLCKYKRYKKDRMGDWNVRILSNAILRTSGSPCLKKSLVWYKILFFCPPWTQLMT